MIFWFPIHHTLWPFSQPLKFQRVLLVFAEVIKVLNLIHFSSLSYIFFTLRLMLSVIGLALIYDRQSKHMFWSINWQMGLGWRKTIFCGEGITLMIVELFDMPSHPAPEISRWSSIGSGRRRRPRTTRRDSRWYEQCYEDTRVLMLLKYPSFREPELEIIWAYHLLYASHVSPTHT